MRLFHYLDALPSKEPHSALTALLPELLFLELLEPETPEAVHPRSQAYPH